MTDTLLIHNCSIMTAATAPLIPDGFIRIEGNRISALGTMAELDDQDHDTTRIDATGQLAMPGLINGHNHSPMTLFRGMADDLDLATWLHEHIFPAEAAHVNEEMVYWCSKLAAAEMLLSGTTTVADAYFHCDASARAFTDSGIRAVIAHGVVDFPAPGVPDPATNIAAVDNFIRTWQNKNSRITPTIFAHSPYTCCPGTLQAAKELARQANLPFFLHIAETEQEQSMIIDPQGPTPLQHIDALGLLDDKTVCVHGIWFDNDDLDILAERRASVVSCPQSNMKLASGTARLVDMFNRGITVGLGTDGCASNNSLDMFRELDVLAKLHKLHHRDATALPAQQALQCATTNNAQILALPNTGTLAPGSIGDIILIDSHTPHLTPFYNQDILVYSASGSDVRTVIVDGRIVVQNRDIISVDINETMERVRRIAARLGGHSSLCAAQ